MPYPPKVQGWIVHATQYWIAPGDDSSKVSKSSDWDICI